MEKSSDFDLNAIANLVQEEMTGFIDFKENETLPYDIALFLMEDQESMLTHVEDEESEVKNNKHNINLVFMQIILQFQNPMNRYETIRMHFRG